MRRHRPFVSLTSDPSRPPSPLGARNYPGHASTSRPEEGSLAAPDALDQSVEYPALAAPAHQLRRAATAGPARKLRSDALSPDTTPDDFDAGRFMAEILAMWSEPNREARRAAIESHFEAVFVAEAILRRRAEQSTRQLPGLRARADGRLQECARGRDLSERVSEAGVPPAATRPAKARVGAQRASMPWGTWFHAIAQVGSTTCHGTDRSVGA
jgi:hypothetical protein